MKVKKVILILLAVLLLAAAGGGYGYYRWSQAQEEETPDYVFTVSASRYEPEQTEEEESVYEAVQETRQAHRKAITVEESQRSYSVSTSSDLATYIGMSVLEAGGNAVDAAVAVAYVLAVAEPYASGLGGSGSMLVYDSNTGECFNYGYRAAAGSASYSSDDVAVPGFVAGMEAVHRDFGSLSMSDLLDPAIYYAENGITVSEHLEYRLHNAKGALSKLSWFYNEEGSFLSQGDTLYQTDLAQVLRAIAAEGAQVFYTGWIAEDIANATSLTAADLAGYQVVRSEAVQGYFEDYTIYSASMPMAGVTLIQMLEMADEMDIASPVEDPALYLRQVEQITALAYGDRYDTIGDPSVYQLDAQALVDKSYILALLGREYDAEDYDLDSEGTETTSFSIVDSNGLTVSCTNTLTQFFGSRIVTDGIFLNNTNENFSSSGINRYEPGKRSRTYTAPTIAVGEDGYVLSLGTPGGNNIPSRLFSVLVDVLKFQEDPQTTVSKTGVLYRNGVLTVGVDDNNQTWLDTSAISGAYVSKPEGIWWGCLSLAGYSDANGAFAAYDSRRGGTMAGVYNPGASEETE